ncbi:phage filamentation protein Fil family protein [Pantoea rwandensis]
MISFAAQLKRQSPSMSYGHGWILGDICSGTEGSPQQF